VQYFQYFNFRYSSKTDCGRESNLLKLFAFSQQHLRISLAKFFHVHLTFISTCDSL